MFDFFLLSSFIIIICVDPFHEVKSKREKKKEVRLCGQMYILFVFMIQNCLFFFFLTESFSLLILGGYLFCLHNLFLYLYSFLELLTCASA